jgi:hypothetical protein
MSYFKYKGKDKYHFRYYRKTKNHPFIVIMIIEEESILIKGFAMTSSSEYVSKRKKDFIELKTNPCKKRKSKSFVSKILITADSKYFSWPIRGWHLSKEDEKIIDKLVEEKLKK